jgi:heat shock protein HtpX
LIGGKSKLIPAFIIGAVFNFFVFIFSDRIALATVRAKELSKEDDPEVWSIMERLPEELRILVPRIYLSPASGTLFSKQHVYS